MRGCVVHPTRPVAVLGTQRSGGSRPTALVRCINGTSTLGFQWSLQHPAFPGSCRETRTRHGKDGRDGNPPDRHRTSGVHPGGKRQGRVRAPAGEDPFAFCTARLANGPDVITSTFVDVDFRSLDVWSGRVGERVE